MKVWASLLLIIFILSFSCLAGPPYTVNVAPAKSEYAPGDSVAVSVTISPAQTVVIMWEVQDPSGIRKDFGQETCQGGRCSFSFTTGSNWPTGTYTVIVAVSGTNDKGYATFALRAPAAPPPPPTPPQVIDYEYLARSRIEATAKSLDELNATLYLLSNLMRQLNLTLSPEYFTKLNKVYELLNKAVNLYDLKAYEDAYSVASSAYQELASLLESFAGDTLQVFRSLARSFLARATDPVTLDLLNNLEKDLASASPKDLDILAKLSIWGRMLVVVARNLKIPDLERNLALLSQKVEELVRAVSSANQTNNELRARLSSLQKERDDLAQKVTGLQTSLSKLAEERDRLAQVNSELSSENAQLRDQLSQSVPRSIAIAVAVFGVLAGAAAGIALGKLTARKRR